MTEYRPLNTSPLPVKLRIEDYLLLDGEGAFEEYRKTELIEGKVLYMNAQHQPHARVKSRLHLLLGVALGDRALEVVVEGSVAIPPISVPEPDIVVAENLGGTGLIPVSSVRLVIEVADSTLDHDRSVKAKIYAQADVPEYWVVDVHGRTITQMWLPGQEGYAEAAKSAFGELIRAKCIDGLEIDTSGLNL